MPLCNRHYSAQVLAVFDLSNFDRSLDYGLPQSASNRLARPQPNL